MAEPSRSRPWLLWCGVSIAALLLLVAARAGMRAPTSMERLHGRIRVGMTYEEVATLAKGYGAEELPPHARNGRRDAPFVRDWGMDDEVVLVAFDWKRDRVIRAEYYSIGDKPSALSKWWKNLFAW